MTKNEVVTKSEDKSALAEHEEAPHNSLSLKAVLLLAVLISIIMVTFSYWLYVRDPNYKYDLARPDVKKQVKLDQEKQLIDEHSKVEQKTVDQTKALVDESLKELDGLDSYKPAPLSDGSFAIN